MAVRTSVSAEDSERSGSQTRLVRRRRPGHRYCRVTRKYLASLQNGDCYVLAEQRLYELILVCHLHICTVLIRNKAVLMFIIVLLISAIIFTPESNKYMYLQVPKCTIHNRPGGTFGHMQIILILLHIYSKLQTALRVDTALITYLLIKFKEWSVQRDVIRSPKTGAMLKVYTPFMVISIYGA